MKREQAYEVIVVEAGQAGRGGSAGLTHVHKGRAATRSVGLMGGYFSVTGPVR